MVKRDADEQAEKAVAVNEAEERDTENVTVPEEPTKEIPEGKTTTPRGKRSAVKSEKVVYGNDDTDTVSLSRIKYKNIYERKVLSVLHLQRRLLDLGFPTADNEGYYGDSTFLAVEAFQRSAGLNAEFPGIVDQETFDAIFDGDDTVRLAA